MIYARPHATSSLFECKMKDARVLLFQL